MRLPTAIIVPEDDIEDFYCDVDSVPVAGGVCSVPGSGSRAYPRMKPCQPYLHRPSIMCRSLPITASFDNVSGSPAVD